MLLRPYGSFHGGIDLPDDKRACLDLQIVPAPRVTRLLVPLSPCGGRPARILVRPHDGVYAGQRIAEGCDESEVDVFSPLSGTVVGLTSACVATDNGFSATQAVEIANPGPPEELQAVRQVGDWSKAGPSELIDRLSRGGLTTFCTSPAPLAGLLRRTGDIKADTVIVNAVEDQPYVTAAHRLLCEFGPDVAAGLAMLARAAGAGRSMLAVDARRTDSYREAVRVARMYDIACIGLPHKYPIGEPSLLVGVLTKRHLPPGANPLDVGVLVLDPACCFAAYRWITSKLPPTHRVVTIVDERRGFAGNFWTPIGAVCTELAGTGGRVAIHGGPMTGLRVTTQAVVGPATDALLCVHEPQAEVAGPCFRCGWCIEHCPARLNVEMLNDCFELGLPDQAHRARVLDCVGCGVCGYICPARLPLAQRVRHLRRIIKGSAGATGAGI